MAEWRTSVPEACDDIEVELDERPREDITDPETGASRILGERCPTCVLRPGNLMDLANGGLADLIRRALAAETYVVCHETLSCAGKGDSGAAICRGFADRYDTRSLRILRAFGRLLEVEPPP